MLDRVAVCCRCVVVLCAFTSCCLAVYRCRTTRNSVCQKTIFAPRCALWTTCHTKTFASTWMKHRPATSHGRTSRSAPWRSSSPRRNHPKRPPRRRNISVVPFDCWNSRLVFDSDSNDLCPEIKNLQEQTYCVL